MNCRFLQRTDFAEIHQTFLEAYSDYIIKFQLTEAQLENHIAQNSVRFEKSVGAFVGNKMIGVTLNGIGLWNSKKTIYDAGTGVIPKFRRKGAGRAMFDFMMPKFKEDGIEQILLEVISRNENALRLYRNLGFEETRNLIFFEQKDTKKIESNKNVEIRVIENPDWKLLDRFRDKQTSWQNSNESVAQTLSAKIILGAYIADKLIGYGVAFPKSGIISQLGVDKEHRRNGVASAVLSELRNRISEETKLRFSNVDENLEDLVKFLGKHGFDEFLAQIEMVKIL